MADMTFETASVALKSGDRIVMYTDGITEAMNVQDEEYGEDRLKEIIRNSPDLSAQELMEKIRDDVEKFSGEAPQADDITLVIVKNTSP